MGIVDTGERIKPDIDFNSYYATLLQAAISPSSTDEEIFHLILTYALELTKSEQGAISTVDATRGRETIFTLNPDNSATLQINTAFSGGASLQNPFFANTPQPDSVWPGIENPVNNFLVVPVEFAGNILGRIALANSVNDYSEAEMALVERLGKILAMVIQNRLREKALRRSAEELTEKNREIKTFADMVAHDFRTPMVNLKGFAKELNCSVTELKRLVLEVRNDVPVKVQTALNQIIDAEIPEALNYINSAIARMDKMVAAMLESARLGRRELIIEDADLSKIVGVVVASFNHHIEQRGIKVKIDPLPVLRTDRLAMEQILGNLIDNAIKYLDPERPGEIKITYTEGDKEAVIAVCDNGLGIVPENLTKIFGLFWRGRHQEPGDGMGLAFVAALLTRLGGTVRCESKLGVGTEMILTLPKDA